MKSPLAIGVDFGATTIKMGIVQGKTVLTAKPPLPTQEYNSPAEIIEAMIQTARQLIEEYPDVQAIGLGMPGWCDYNKGVLYQLTNVPVWNHEIPVQEIMEKNLNLPVALDNDANCMAYAEWKLGAGQGMNSLVCLTLGTGIGGGIIINDQLVRGKRCSTGELGQTSIYWKGRKGHFGNLGAIEDYIGNNEFALEARLRYKAAGIDKELNDCSPTSLTQYAQEGDPVALALWNDYARMLGCLIMNMTYALVPEAFIIGGGVAKAGEFLFRPLRQCLKEQLFIVHYEDLNLLPAKFGNEAGIIGAALMALEKADTIAANS